ncbi:MAG: 2-amino-4-hydroxy-6-hydroxymethyldihydropteridine diphosphokinase [Gammaproteobacteria bacterium]|nr:2-amino-4-hydroxy-6-hydroxymethyldihydropteridine diphosphokinase [Gammaproteobacteria bacterium]MBU0786128.1 2-amino-4-hydroxy-6-hydroxymethyldihydropteridine diphosphokinase [Gammaproteobacteria bacterium]MBU0816708.1 2-amino-4-hydroxy-6-hydroxymethyldihydropteridine diphosphokinase [Gammaproteobacteria bacterium]MBU1786872.1 2-amino-4-hydroxy-6-hydroxymethyldihydropteridine diphosphokinase [Gammaproteobacteria bacterium]
MPAPPVITAYVALGANLGDARATVLQAMDALATMPGTVLTRRSSLYRTAPVDSSGPDYINAVVELSTQLGAIELLHALQRLEQAAGRERPYPNAPRTLDLDLLSYDKLSMETDELVLPHPRIHERAFVLVPLAEIAPTKVPAEQLAAVAGQTINRLN